MEHWKTHKAACKGSKKPAAAAATASAPTRGAAAPVFGSEASMLEHLAKMGMPPDVMGKMTPAQKAAMLRMTADPGILAKAEERLASELGGQGDKEKRAALNAAAAAMGVEGRSVDGSLVPAPGGAFRWLDAKASASIEVDCPTGTGAGDVAVSFEKDALLVRVGGCVALAGPTFQAIDAAKCSWKLEGLTLAVTLVKEKPMRWLQVVRT